MESFAMCFSVIYCTVCAVAIMQILLDLQNSNSGRMYIPSYTGKSKVKKSWILCLIQNVVQLNSASPTVCSCNFNGVHLSVLRPVRRDFNEDVNGVKAEESLWVTCETSWGVLHEVQLSLLRVFRKVMSHSTEEVTALPQFLCSYCMIIPPSAGHCFSLQDSLLSYCQFSP